MLNTKFFVEIGPLVQDKIFEGILPYMGMAASWSCDKIWFKMAQWSLRKASFNLNM